MMLLQMVGIWCVWMWHELGKPHSLRLVELGPGRGTLVADLLRSTATFREFAMSVSADLVEVGTFCMSCGPSRRLTIELTYVSCRELVLSNGCTPIWVPSRSWLLGLCTNLHWIILSMRCRGSLCKKFSQPGRPNLSTRSKSNRSSCWGHAETALEIGTRTHLELIMGSGRLPI